MNVQGFLETLPIMLKGMGGIFIVILLLYGTIVLLKKLFPQRAEKDGDVKKS